MLLLSLSRPFRVAFSPAGGAYVFRVKKNHSPGRKVPGFLFVGVRQWRKGVAKRDAVQIMDALTSADARTSLNKKPPEGGLVQGLLAI